MRKKFAYWMTCILLCFSGCKSNPPRKMVDQQVALEQAVALVGSDRVFRLWVFYVPETTLVEGGVHEGNLEATAWGQVSVAPFRVCQLRTKLLSRLGGSSMILSDKPARDFRWGCVFYSNRGERLARLYLNRDGYGLMNGVSVKTDGQVLDLLRKEFAWLVNSW
jgi:hypothetical protein